MKRRHFINGIAALFGMGTAIPWTAKASVVTDQNELFRRFFKTATGYQPSANQLHWFEMFNQAEKGQLYCDSFQGPRQSGMTTFMLVLALFQSKVHCKNVFITPSNYGSGYLCNVALGKMRLRLGKSIHDGIIQVGGEGRGTRFDFQFIMNDAPGLAKTADKYSDRVYKFRTTERTFHFKYKHTT